MVLQGCDEKCSNLGCYQPRQRRKMQLVDVNKAENCREKVDSKIIVSCTAEM